MKRITRLLFLAALALAPASLLQSVKAQADPPLLLRHPSLSKDQIAFLYADDIWTVSRAGGQAERLTSVAAVHDGPFYSPDGSEIAYSARLHGNTDIYIVPANGGIPRRITWNPAGSSVVGWSPDGKDVLFTSFATSFRDYQKLFRAHADGTGIPEALPLPSGVEGSLSPDGKSIAYQPITKWEQAWKQYHGGQNTPIWIVNLKTLDLERIPRQDSSDSNPLWVKDKVGEEIFFLSNRGGSVALYRYNVTTKAVTPAVPNKGFDLKSAQAGPGGIVYEQFGSIHLYDPDTNAEHPVSITIHGDLPGLEPHLASISPEEIRGLGLSPTGVRAVVEAHGEIFTLPGEKGDTRDLTHTPGAAERDPAWSPDGKTIAYFSDASGEYQLYLQDQNGFKPPVVVDLGPNPSFFYSPTWSPDSKHIVYSDKHLHLWVIDVPTKDAPKPKPVLVDTGTYGGFGGSTEAVWSPDSKWIAYPRDLDNHLNAIFLYSLETHKATQVTDGMSDASSPAFDQNGKYLYFLASTDDGPSTAGIDLSSLDRAQTESAYVLVLAKDGLSPVPPESDEEKVKEEKAESDKSKDDKDKDSPDKPKDDGKKADANKGDKEKKADDKADAAGDEKDSKAKDDKATTIDLEGIGSRILALPIPARNYGGLLAGKTGVIYLIEGLPFGRSSSDDPGPNIRGVWRFTLEKRQPEELLTDLNAFLLSADGGKALYVQHGGFLLASTDDLKSPKPLNVGSMEAMVDPRAEWRQIFTETWRIERDFLYDPNTHGLSIPKIEARYRPYLAGLASRSEFTYLSTEMLGEINVGHMFVGGPRAGGHGPKTGLLGADYATDHGRYRFAHIYTGQNWSPGLTAPLTQPGVSVKEGDYLLAVNGRQIHAGDNLFAFFDGLAGKQTVLRIGGTPDAPDPLPEDADKDDAAKSDAKSEKRKADPKLARDVTVIPIDDESGLRNLDWMEANRRKVDELSGGKVAYVYMPNTGGTGYTNFNRYFYAQLDKQALVLDERYNDGGFIADYIVDVLKRFPLSGGIERDGKPMHDPVGAIFGPKAMLINQNSGSGGDAMPWYFRKAGIGKLVGTRTWGGLVGIGGYPTLLDGGYVMAPRYAIYGLTGDWEVENKGIPPDVMVEDLPKDVAAGHDRQLEEGVKLVLEELKANPIPAIPIPTYPNYHKNDGLGK